MFGEFGVLPARIHEQPAVPIHQAQFGETELTGLEPLGVLEAWRTAQRAVELVRPRVVGADDAAALGRCAARQQFVAAVPAGVGERAHHSVVAAHQQHPVGTRTDRALTARRGDVVGVADAGPAGEDRTLLPLEHLGIDVRLPAAACVTARTAPARPRGHRRARGLDRLFEHTVRIVGGCRRSRRQRSLPVRRERAQNVRPRGVSRANTVARGGSKNGFTPLRRRLRCRGRWRCRRRGSSAGTPGSRSTTAARRPAAAGWPAR